MPDPLAERHYGMTPYHYVLNNPVLYIDPMGLDTINMNNLHEGQRLPFGSVLDFGHGVYIDWTEDLYTRYFMAEAQVYGYRCVDMLATSGKLELSNAAYRQLMSGMAEANGIAARTAAGKAEVAKAQAALEALRRLADEQRMQKAMARNSQRFAALQQNLGTLWEWTKEHFDVAAGYSLSYGAQIGGGFKRIAEARVNIYSTVHSDLEWSLKRGWQGDKYKSGEKTNWGIGGAYYGGINYKGESYQGATEHELSLGIYGLGATIKFDNSFNMTDWFIGLDPSVNMQFIFGVEGNFRIGFSK